MSLKIPTVPPRELDPAPFGDIYKLEFLRLVSNIALKSEAIFARAPAKQCGNDYLAPDPELHSIIASLLSDAANAKNLIVDEIPKSKISKQLASMRQKRARALLEEVKGIELTALLDKKVRNSIEHFDEYLDQANVVLGGKPSTNRLALFNFVLSSRRLFEQYDRTFPLRVYIADERVYENFELKIDIGKLYAESVQLRDRLLKSFDGKIDGFGALMLSI
jgi:hypothetical protein